MKDLGSRVLRPTAYDAATDEFCRALGLSTNDVLHLAVGPRHTIAHTIARNLRGELTGEEAVISVERGPE